MGNVQGPVGLSATLLASAMGVRVIAVEVGAQRLALAEEFGTDATVDGNQVDVVSWRPCGIGSRISTVFKVSLKPSRLMY